MKPTYPAKMYCVHRPVFAYATLTDFGDSKGLLQIHSDWGTYSHFWGSIGGRNIREFVLSCDAGYIETKLSSNLHQMGMKKESFIRLTKFMAQCWPGLRDVMGEDPQ